MAAHRPAFKAFVSQYLKLFYSQFLNNRNVTSKKFKFHVVEFTAFAVVHL